MGISHFEGVVVEYLRADRALFVNPECCIQINEGDNPDTSGPHWYCDAVAADFREHVVFLCEISFASPPKALEKRLAGWAAHWSDVCAALVRDSHLPVEWPVRPWLFVPEQQIEWIVGKVRALQANQGSAPGLPEPRITPLEWVQPWRFRSWDRRGEESKPSSVPEGMRS